MRKPMRFYANGFPLILYVWVFSFILVLHKQYTGNVLGICLYFWEEI
jgi:hypothetical protein